MTQKSNGHDPDDKNNEERIVKFPTLAERDRILKKQRDQENAWRKQYRKQQKANTVPFFNFGHVPPFTKIFIGTIVAIHLVLTFFASPETRVTVLSTFAFIPSDFKAENSTWIDIFTPITYLFLHQGWAHIIFNAVMGLALGTFVEKMFSTRTTVKFFFICGIAGAALFFLIHPFVYAPVIGASAAISGLFAAAILMMVEQGRFGMLPPKLTKSPWPIVFIWAAIMTFIGIIGGGIAWEAHLGGFLTGALLYRLMRTNRLRL